MKNTYGSIGARTAGYAVKRLLKRAQIITVTERFGQFDPQPKKASKVRKYRRYTALPTATSPLAEGVPPTGQQVTSTDVSLTLEQYGDALQITDVIMDTHEDNLLNEMIDLCGEQAAETIEELRINVLKAGSNVFYAAGVAGRATVNSPATLNDFRAIERFFNKNKARKISKIVKASAMVSTEPVAPAFFAMGHTDLLADIRGISGFTPVEKYSDAMKALPNEVGKVESTRIILTPYFTPWETSGASGTTYLSGGEKVGSAAACDVYPLIFVARDAYAIVPLQGDKSGKGPMPVTPRVINPDSLDKSDPLGQIGWVSWKTWQGSVILNQAYICRLECAATAL